jgi:hypothetical protein
MPDEFKDRYKHRDSDHTKHCNSHGDELNLDDYGRLVYRNRQFHFNFCDNYYEHELPNNHCVQYANRPSTEQEACHHFRVKCTVVRICLFRHSPVFKRLFLLRKYGYYNYKYHHSCHSGRLTANSLLGLPLSDVDFHDKRNNSVNEHNHRICHSHNYPCYDFLICYDNIHQHHSQTTTTSVVIETTPEVLYCGIRGMNNLNGRYLLQYPYSGNGLSCENGCYADPNCATFLYGIVFAGSSICNYYTTIPPEFLNSPDPNSPFFYYQRECTPPFTSANPGKRDVLLERVVSKVSVTL